MLGAAHLCRYGNQRLEDVLGHVPDPLEWTLFGAALDHWLGLETQDVQHYYAGLGAGSGGNR